MTTSKEYFAFISYKREDEKWAKWLQNELEGYHLPTKIAKGNPNIPKEIRPIFRDTTELKSGKLKQQIEEALNTSKFLIVICSPHAAQSVWVNREIEIFIQEKGVEKIIPFIIEGTAFAKNPDEECFPPVLRNMPENQEILGANIQEMGSEAAKIKVIAHMLDVKFDTLWNRYERAKRRKRLMGLLFFSLITTISATTATLFAQQNKELKLKNFIIEAKNDSIQAQKDSIAVSNNLLRANRDSLQNALNLINSQKKMIESSNKQLRTSRDSIASQKDLLEIKSQDLITANEKIRKERDNVKAENWKMMINRAKAVAGIADNLMNNGDYSTAKLIALECMPTDINNPIDKPYIPEIEATLRQASKWNSGGVQLSTFSSNEDVLSVGQTGHLVVPNGFDLQIVNMYTGAVEGRINQNGSKLTCSPDGSKFAYCCYEDEKYKICIRSFDSNHSDKKKPINDISFYHEFYVDVHDNRDYQNLHFIFSFDNNTILYSKGNVVYKHDIANNEDSEFLIGHKDIINDINISFKSSAIFKSNKEIILTASNDSTVKTWDAKTGNLLHTFNGHKDNVKQAFFLNPNYNTKVLSADSKNVILWDAETNDTVFTKLIDSDSFVVERSRASNYFICLNQGSVDQYDVNNGELIKRLNDKYYNVYKCDDYTGRIVTIANDWLTFRNPLNDNHSYMYSNAYEDIHNGLVTDIAINNKKKMLISASNDSTIVLFQIHKKGLTKVKKFEGHKNTISSVTFSPTDSCVFASASHDSTIILWHTTTGRLMTFKGHQDIINDIAFSPNGEFLISASSDKKLIIWDKQGHQIQTIEEDMPVIKAEFIDNHTIAYIKDFSQILIRQINKSKTILDIKSKRHDIMDFAFSPNRKDVAIQKGDSVFIWSWDGNTIKKAFWAPGVNLTYFPNGKTLATNNNYEIAICDIKEGVLLEKIPADFALRIAVAENDDSNIIYTGNFYNKKNRQLSIFKYFPIEYVMKSMQYITNNRRLTYDEKKKYYLDN